MHQLKFIQDLLNFRVARLTQFLKKIEALENK